MLNPHTPSELLEEKLCYAGLTDMPHPGKLCWLGALPMDGASTDNCHCDSYSRSLYIQLWFSYKHALSQEMGTTRSRQAWSWGRRKKCDLTAGMNGDGDTCGWHWVLPAKNRDVEIGTCSTNQPFSELRTPSGCANLTSPRSSCTHLWMPVFFQGYLSQFLKWTEKNPLVNTMHWLILGRPPPLAPLLPWRTTELHFQADWLFSAHVSMCWTLIHAFGHWGWEGAARSWWAKRIRRGQRILCVWDSGQ